MYVHYTFYMCSYNVYCIYIYYLCIRVRVLIRNIYICIYKIYTHIYVREEVRLTSNASLDYTPFARNSNFTRRR